MSRTTSRTVALLCFLSIAAQTARAQNKLSFTIDAKPAALLIGFGWPVSPRTYVGFAIGGGIDILGKTLSPNPSSNGEFHDFEQFLHVDALLRRRPHEKVDIDLGARAGIGEVRSCRASDCLPGPYAGLYAAMFYGRPRFKLGTRIVVARVWDGGSTDAVVHWEPISVRIGR